MASKINKTIQNKFQKTREELSATLIEREPEIDLTLTALVAREHVLFVGLPGVAKSLLAQGVVNWIDGNKFEYLFSKDADPMDIFGPYALTKLKADKYERVPDGYLPTCHVAYLDEIFNASSAILNTLNWALNERQFKNGTQVLDIPLQLAVCSTNRFPEDEDGHRTLHAMFDRLLFRKVVNPIQSRGGLDKLLWADDLSIKLSTKLSVKELAKAQEDAARIKWSDAAKDALVEIINELSKNGIEPGDRRKRKAVNAVRAFAYVNGADEVTTDHLEVLEHVLWDEPNEQPAKVADIIGKIANPIGMKVTGLLAAADQIVRTHDLSDLGEAATAASKLADVKKQLAAMNGNGRAKAATKYVEDEIKRVKRATIESL